MRTAHTKLLRGGILVLVLVLGAVFVLSEDARAQSIDGTVVQDPNSGTATYTLDLHGSSSGNIYAFAIPLIHESWYLPGSLFAPNGWSGQLLPLGLSPWSYNPSLDPKTLLGLYTQDPSIYINPPFVIHFQADSPADRVAPGGFLGGFQFKSTQKPVNGPALYASDISGGYQPVDPPIPGPAAVVPLPPAAPLGLGMLAAIGLAAALRRRRRNGTSA